MRPPAEIRFRLKQELANLRLYLLPPGLPRHAHISSPLRLPDPIEALRGSRCETDIIAAADQVLSQRIPLLGTVFETGRDIPWRRDFASGIETGTEYFRRIRYLDASRVGDHKNIWELSRHQHLVALAQAWRFTGRRAYLDEMVRQLSSWLDANPFQRGINWTSALEVAFRALSWVWMWHLSGSDFPDPLKGRFLTALYRHGLHLQYNLSFYFSPNTHLLGEAVALHALGVLLPEVPEAKQWQRLGGDTVRAELDHQVANDGSHFEQSTYYQLYALDMFLFHSLLAEDGSEYKSKLAAMAEYLASISGRSGIFPRFGDDDGGRFFHPFAGHEQYAMQTLATCAVYLGAPAFGAQKEDLAGQAAWWIGPEVLTDVAGSPEQRLSRSRHFTDSGTVVLAYEGTQIVFDAGPFGSGSAGHSHSDTLHFVVKHQGADLLIDPGTYTYVGDAALRDRFRGSAMHNTVRIDGLNQAVPVTPFSWRDKPRVTLVGWSERHVDARCEYAGFVHRRRLGFVAPHLIAVIDDITGPEGSHQIEQFWHPGIATTAMDDRTFAVGNAVLSLSISGELSKGGEYGWFSPAMGDKRESPVIRAAGQATLPWSLAAVLDLSGAQHPVTIEGSAIRYGGSVISIP